MLSFDVSEPKIVCFLPSAGRLILPRPTHSGASGADWGKVFVPFRNKWNRWNKVERLKALKAGTRRVPGDVLTVGMLLGKKILCGNDHEMFHILFDYLKIVGIGRHDKVLAFDG